MPGAKETSKLAIIVAVLYATTVPIVAAQFHWAITVDDILKISAAIVLFNSPIFISIITDKLRGKPTADADGKPQGGDQ